MEVAELSAENNVVTKEGSWGKGTRLFKLFIIRYSINELIFCETKRWTVSVRDLILPKARKCWLLSVFVKKNYTVNTATSPLEVRICRIWLCFHK